MDESLGKSCRLCGYLYCADHLLPQRHQCAMLQNVEYVKAGSSQNVDSSPSGSEASFDTSAKIDPDVEKVNVITTPPDGVPYWLSDCLEDAKGIILEYHDDKPDDKNFVDCIKFFAAKSFDVKIQNNGNASGDINVIKDLPSQPSYKIFVHDIFKEDTRDNRRMVTIVIVHQLLHAIHPSKTHDSVPPQKGINRIEHDLANRARYHDALLNLESLHQSGKVHPCNL